MGRRVDLMRDELPRDAARLRGRPRPRRGRPEETRERLIVAAADVFNRVGYDGTDSNRLARAAGYAPATFYKHFPDKRAIFLAAYQRWVDTEWARIEGEIRRVEDPRARARRIVDATIAHHTRWRGLRASLRALVARDATVRVFYRAQRRRQLEMLARFGRARLPLPERRARHALLLYALERVCDAVADGELRSLGVAVEPIAALLQSLLIDFAG